MFKFVILTCLWKRPELTNLFLEYYNNMANSVSEHYEIKLVAVGSEGDITKNKSLLNNFHYLETPNKPLSFKWNSGIQLCRELNPDAVVILGSDDFVSKNLFDFYYKKINDNYTVIGFKDMYLLDANSEKTFKWKGYSKTLQPDRYGETTGMARCLNKITLETLDYDIWGRVRANASMDRYMCKALLSIGIGFNSKKMKSINGINYKWSHEGYYMDEANVACVDVKTNTNMNSVNSFYSINPDSIEIIEDNNRFFKKYFQLDYNNFINSINNKLDSKKIDFEK